MVRNYELVSFSAIVQKSAEKRRSIYVIWPESASFFGTHTRVKVRASVDGEVFESTFMPMGDGNHKLPLKSYLLEQIEKEVGDEVSVRILERMDTGPSCDIP